MEKLQGNLSDLIAQSVHVQEKSAPASRERSISDCVNFGFDIKVLSVKGKICSSGIFEATISVIGIDLGTVKIDLSKGEYCNKISVGIEEVQYCFYLKDNCLYTKGYVDGWLHPKESWDAKIVCL